MSSDSGANRTNLLADVGGTNARFALSNKPFSYDKVVVFKTADFPSLDAALSQYLRIQGNPEITDAVIGMANPVLSDHLEMTNTSWSLSIEGTRQKMGFKNLHIINDFTALALSIPKLPAHELLQVGGDKSVARTPLGVLGPGTGLGVSALIPDGVNRWIPLSTEGGHVSFAPRTNNELILWHAACSLFEHVSMERLLSGAGLQFIYGTLCQAAGCVALTKTPAEISQQAIENTCIQSRQALDTFCAILGTAAAHVALTFGARSGIYIGGGIVPRLGSYFVQSPFRERFEQAGRLSDYMRTIPVFVINSPYPGLLGAAAYLER